VDPRRNATQKNHTATHLLQWALQQVLGQAVHQQGSLVGPDYLRFDFTCPKALTAGQIEDVERLVREKIDQALPVTCAVLPIDRAKKLGGHGPVRREIRQRGRVLGIGADHPDRIGEAFSREFLRGTHVDNTGAIADSPL